jgi:hypothetical protein
MTHIPSTHLIKEVLRHLRVMITLPLHSTHHSKALLNKVLPKGSKTHTSHLSRHTINRLHQIHIHNKHLNKDMDTLPRNLGTHHLRRLQLRLVPLRQHKAIYHTVLEDKRQVRHL